MDVQERAWGRFHSALGAEQYRLVFVSRDPLKKYKDKDGNLKEPTFLPHPDGRIQTKTVRQKEGERFWKADEVQDAIKRNRLGKWNKDKYDMYIRPFSEDFHYIFIDDVKGTKGVDAIKAEGYKTALVQESSKDNFQVILKVPKGDGDPVIEREATNALSQELNRKHGDKGAGREIQNFRIPGFMNKKLNRDNHPTTIDLKRSDSGQTCQKAAMQLEDWKKAIAMSRDEQEQSRRVQQDRTMKDLLDLGASPDKDVRTYAAVQRTWIGRMSTNGPVNLSEVDFHVAKDLIKSNQWTPEQVGSAMKVASPNLSERKKEWTPDYITRTVGNAGAKAKEEIAQKAAQERREQEAARTMQQAREAIQKNIDQEQKPTIKPYTGPSFGR